MNSPIRTLLILLTLLSCASPSGGTSGPATELSPREPEHAWVIFGADSVRVEVARTEAERERGLMFREAVPDGTGMLFVFPRPEIQGVWMKDTHVALDAAFLDEDAIVMGIEPLEPGAMTVKYSESPVMFVLETPRGWLARYGVTVGDSAEIVFQVDWGPRLLQALRDPHQGVLQVDAGHPVLDTPVQRIPELGLEEPELIPNEGPDVRLADVEVGVQGRIVPLAGGLHWSDCASRRRW